MAKDARGHGSEGRGGESPRVGALLRQAARHAMLFGVNDARVGSAIRAAAGVKAAEAAATLAQGHPKSAPPPVAYGQTGPRGKVIPAVPASQNRGPGRYTFGKRR